VKRWATSPVTAPRCQLRGKAGAEEVEDAGLDEAVGAGLSIAPRWLVTIVVKRGIWPVSVRTSA